MTRVEQYWDEEYSAYRFPNLMTAWNHADELDDSDSYIIDEPLPTAIRAMLIKGHLL